MLQQVADNKQISKEKYESLKNPSYDATQRQNGFEFHKKHKSDNF